MKLLHASILHRHGARGPGASELGLWEEGTDCEVLANWRPTEIEQLGVFGHQMVCNLGKWFAETYHGKVESKALPLWRCSSSGRGKESGHDFIQGFSSMSGKGQNIAAVERDLSADHYFRPWKIYAAEAKFVKSRIKSQPKWVAKGEEHRDFLVRIFSLLKVMPKNMDSMTTLLWSTTYLVAIRDCESFATTPSESKLCLSNLIPNPDDWKLLNELACWVWSERFLFSGFEVHMGGHLCVDIFEDLLRPPSGESGHNLSIFSGHDYTILGLLGLMKGLEDMTSSVGFSSYVIFELWEGDAPFLGGSDAPSGVPPSNKFVRVKYNANPFFDYSAGTISPVIQMANEKVLRDYSVAEIELLVAGVKVQQEKLGMLRVSTSGGSSPVKECHSIGVSPLRTNVSAEEQMQLINELDTFIETKMSKKEQDTSLQACSEDNG